jgi:hypothetical protein
MSTWDTLISNPRTEEHVVQLYGSDDQLLIRNVCRYLVEGLTQGDGLFVLATEAHTASILEQLHLESAQTGEALREGRLVCADAQATLNRILADGRPDPQLFRAVLEPSLSVVRERARSGKVRAFGEMVGLLWINGERDEAIRVEEFWNELLKGSEFSLYCAYPIDIFGNCSQMPSLKGVIATHTHTLAGPATLLSREPISIQY